MLKAAENGDLSGVKAEIEGNNVDTCTDENGAVAIMFAAWKGHGGYHYITYYLVRYGVSVSYLIILSMCILC